MTIENYLTIDVEDYFQVSAFEDVVAAKGWDAYPGRVERNTRIVLELLEKYQVKATFFILGWTADKFPKLVKDIHRNGHEVACHSYYHRLVYRLTPEEFYEDTKKSKDCLEQIIGQAVVGYRAPSYSITRASLWAIKILHELGFCYSSSIFPIYHDRYGIPNAPRFPFLWQLDGEIPVIVDHAKVESIDQILNVSFPNWPDGVPNRPSSLLEIPLTTSVYFSKNFPISGGGYFRLFPYWYTEKALHNINAKEGKPFIFYFHPWEIDPDQPRIAGAGPRSRLRHYINLAHTYGKLERLLRRFSFKPICQIQTIKEVPDQAPRATSW